MKNSNYEQTKTIKIDVEIKETEDMIKNCEKKIYQIEKLIANSNSDNYQKYIEEIDKATQELTCYLYNLQMLKEKRESLEDDEDE